MWGRGVIEKEKEEMFQARSPSLRVGSLLLLGGMEGGPGDRLPLPQDQEIPD